MRKVIFGLTALVAAWAFSIASYGRLPENVPIRWNLEFEPSGTASRLVAAVVIPSAFLLLPALAWALSRIDPRRESYARHRSTYWLLWNAIMAALAVLQVLVVGLALGWAIDAARVFPIVIGVLLLVVGNYTTRLRPNWFLGIRTPWTLSDDDVWRRTHRSGARMIMAGGVLLVVGGLMPTEWVRSALWVTAFVLAVPAPIVYSYFAWARTARAQRRRS